jgi:PII-like signaling protein
MKLEGEQILLRLHLSNFEKWRGGPLYEALVDRARREHLAGATVLAGFHGYVERGRILGDHPNAVQVERPMIVEIVDREETLERFLTGIEPMLTGHAVRFTLERARVVHYRGGGPVS